MSQTDLPFTKRHRRGINRVVAVLVPFSIGCGLVSTFYFSVRNDDDPEKRFAAVQAEAKEVTEDSSFPAWSAANEKALKEKYHFSFVEIADLNDRYQVNYITDAEQNAFGDSSKCQGHFAFANGEVWIQDGSACVKLLGPESVSR